MRQHAHESVLTLIFDCALTDRYCRKPDSSKCGRKGEMRRAMEMATAPIHKKSALPGDGERKGAASNPFENPVL